MSDNNKDISEFFREVPPFLKVFNITNAYPTDDDQFIVEFSPGEELTHSNGMVVQGGFVTGMLDCCMAQFLIYKAKGKQIPLTLDIDVKFLRPCASVYVLTIFEAILVSKIFLILHFKENSNEFLSNLRK